LRKWQARDGHACAFEDEFLLAQRHVIEDPDDQNPATVRSWPLSTMRGVTARTKISQSAQTRLPHTRRSTANRPGDRQDHETAVLKRPSG
jgi:hypothetical protein